MLLPMPKLPSTFGKGVRSEQSHSTSIVRGTVVLVDRHANAFLCYHPVGNIRMMQYTSMARFERAQGDLRNIDFLARHGEINFP
jgi:hypothetical protein